MANEVQAVTDQEFDTDVLKASEPVLVDFWAPWCGPCRMVAPIVEELSGEYSGKVRFRKHDRARGTALLGPVDAVELVEMVPEDREARPRAGGRRGAGGAPAEPGGQRGLLALRVHAVLLVLRRRLRGRE